jgi:hypothetical protein
MRALAAVGAFFFCTAAAVCGSKATAPTAPTTTITSVAISAASPFTGIGQQIQFTATATRSDGTTENVTASSSWQSTNTNVLSIASSGIATSVSEGDVQVKATYESVSGVSTVNISVQWVLKGRVLATADRSPVTTGVTISAAGAPSISYGPDGAYTLQGPGVPGSKLLMISAPGYLTRNTAAAISNTRVGVDIDVISLASPFSLSFYRELLRGSADNGGNLQMNFRWESSPNFYINMRNGSSDMSPAVIADLVAWLPALVTQVSDGRLSAQRIETGTETRPQIAGWINIEYTTAISSCGLGSVGGNLARINPICSDLTFVGLHEVTHVLGFWHHTQFGGLMSRVGPDTRLRGLSAIEAFHTKIAFSRPRGNTDPDNDPSSAHLLGTSRTGDAPLLACWPIR